MFIFEYADEETYRDMVRANIKGEEEPDKNSFLGGTILSVPDLTKTPHTFRVRDRLQKYLSSVYMNMEQTPIWDKMGTFSSALPFLEEPIFYAFTDEDFGEYEGINATYKMKGTFLTYINKLNPVEWKNFRDHLRREIPELRENGKELEMKMMRKISKEEYKEANGIDEETYNNRMDDLRMMDDLRYGDRLGSIKNYVDYHKDALLGKYGSNADSRKYIEKSRHALKDPYMEMEIRKYVSYRFQPMGRTPRGVMRFRRHL